MKCLRNCTGNCSPNNITNCTGCAPGYYILPSVNCKPCPTGCTECTSATSCTSCASGYTPSNSSGSLICIEQCQYPCVTCTTSTKCLTCIAGYYAQGNKCILNLTCSPSVCKTCPSGSYGSPPNCYACPQACQNCSSISSCSACNAGAYLSSSSCLLCPTPCSTCSGQLGISQTMLCDICADGYFISAATTTGLICAPCSVNCFTCT